MTEFQAKAAVHLVTRRAQTYLGAGLPLDQVLDAMKISRATWYRRLDALDGWEAETRAGAEYLAFPG